MGVAGISVDYLSLDALSDSVLNEATELAEALGAGHPDIHSLASITSPSLNFAYGITDDLLVAIRLPYVKRRGIREAHEDEGDEHEGEDAGDEQLEASANDRGSSSGLGDLTVLGQWRILNDVTNGTQMAVLGGFKAPTGETNQRDREGERFDAEFQPGSGSWDGLFGAAFTQRIGAWSFDTSVLYTLVTEGVLDTDLGDRLNYGIALTYRISGSAHHDDAAHAGPPHGSDHTHAHSGPNVDLILELNGEWSDNEETSGARDPNSGGNTLYLSPGVRLSQDRWSAFASVGVPVMADFNGTQPEPDLRVITGVSVGF